MVSLKAAAAAIGAVLLSHSPACLAMPTSDYNPSFTPNYDRGLINRAEPQDFFLRIMPLGASITAGVPQPPDDDSKNGYRKLLRDKLRFDGWKVNMVGNFNSGSMRDNVSTHLVTRLKMMLI